MKKQFYSVMRRSTDALVWMVFLWGFICIGCSSRSENILNPISSDKSGSVNLTITVGEIGTLGKMRKVASIDLNKILISLEAEDEVTRYDSIFISGNKKVTRNKLMENLTPEKEWTVNVTVYDMLDSLTHQGNSTFMVCSDSTVDVIIDLSPVYTMLTARFSPIDSTMSKCRVLMDDCVVINGNITTEIAEQGTMTLNYDYLPVGSHKFTMEVLGEMMGTEYIFYTASDTIDLEAGAKLNKSMTLKWVGPYYDADLQVIVNPVGMLSLKGKIDKNSKE